MSRASRPPVGSLLFTLQAAVEALFRNSLMWHQNHVRRSLCFVGLLMVGALITGCNKTEPSGPSSGGNGKKAKAVYTIGMSQCNLGEPWRVEMNAQIKAAADKHPNLKVTFKDAQNDTLKQRAHVEEFVSAAVDLIIICPKEAQPLSRPVAKAIEAGIPVIVLDRRLIGTNYACFIG